MEPERTFEIAARIDHLSHGVGCFDPVQVMSRMRSAFPDLIEDRRDYLWEVAGRLRGFPDSGADAAFRAALRDLQERGPKILLAYHCQTAVLSKAPLRVIGFQSPARRNFPKTFDAGSLLFCMAFHSSLFKSLNQALRRNPLAVIFAAFGFRLASAMRWKDVASGSAPQSSRPTFFSPIPSGL